MEILPVIILYLEIALLAFAEKRLWKTWFTPINCLSVPYAIVLAVCLWVDGSMGYVPFHYPSVWVWVAGLAVFFVPSCILGSIHASRNKGVSYSFARPLRIDIPEKTIRFLEWVTWGVLALFVFWFFYLKSHTPFIPGGEYFARIWASKGFFGHLFTLFMVLTIAWTFLADKKHKRFWLYLLAFFIVALLNLSKSWFLIPLAGGLLLRLVAGKTRFGIKVILVSLFVGFAFFFASYWMTLYVASAEKDVLIYKDLSLIEKKGRYKYKEQAAYQSEVSSYIVKHAVTYVSAGVYGLSEDMAQGVLEYYDPSKIHAPLINISKVFGDKEYVSQLNDKYIEVTRYDLGTNVRSFFGTLYVHLGAGRAIAYVLVFSSLVYGLFHLALSRKKLLPFIIFGWVEGTLLMGWFDPIVQTLNFFTVPFFTLLLFGACRLLVYHAGLPRMRFRHKARNLLAAGQTILTASLLLFFWMPFRIPSYLLGVSVAVAFLFALTVPKRGFDFRFLKPYLALFASYLLLWISVSYSAYPGKAILYSSQQIAILLVPFVFWGMTPRFFSARRMKWFAFCFVGGCLLDTFAKFGQLSYCFSILWPYFKVHYIESGLLSGSDNAFLYILNDFIFHQTTYLRWAQLEAIMHTTLEAIVINLAFAIVFIARVERHPWLASRTKRFLADLAMFFFSIVLITTTSKTGQGLFVLTLVILTIYAIRKKSWKTICRIEGIILAELIIGCLYFSVAIGGRFSQTLQVFNNLEEKEMTNLNDGSLLPRIYCWETAWKMTEQKPVLGYGSGYRCDFENQFEKDYPHYRSLYQHPHNHFLGTLLATGIAGLLVFLCFWVQATRLVWKNRRMWGWIWLFGLFLLCSIERTKLLYMCLPYCFLMMEYHHRRKEAGSLPEHA